MDSQKIITLILHSALLQSLESFIHITPFPNLWTKQKFKVTAVDQVSSTSHNTPEVGQAKKKAGKKKCYAYSQRLIFQKATVELRLPDNLDSYFQYSAVMLLATQFFQTTQLILQTFVQPPLPRSKTNKLIPKISH